MHRVLEIASCLVALNALACGAAPRATLPPAAAQIRTGPVDVEADGAHLRLSVLSPDVVRVLISRAGATKLPASFAVETSAQAASAPYTLVESAGSLLVRTARLSVRITKRPLTATLLDTQGQLLSQQAAPVTWGDSGFSASFSLAPQAQIYGLGDKVKGFDRRGQSFELWNTDAYGWKPDADPLYKAIPFLFFLDAGRAHGLFFDSPARAVLDVGQDKSDELRYTTEAGQAFDFYWFVGPEPKDVLRSYTALTGRTPLPPRWALGYHQSRYSYLTEQEARGVAERLRAERIPSDALWLDIDYQKGNAPFTVDTQAFPNFAGMVADFTKLGLHTVVITDPHPKSYQGSKLPSGYAPYDSGAAGDHFLHDPHGGFFEDKVWPGLSVFPEFTLSRTRRWWGDLYTDFVAQGVAGFWNDMNEPASFSDTKTLPPFVQHRLDDGSTLEHTFVHNAYGGLNARATYEGLRRLRPNVRPFVLTRAAYAGTQRYAATWTGDNSATREHLALSIGQLANLGVSGYAFSGVDAGGFVGCPDADLLSEWLEVAAFQPFFRNHSAKDACRREPWVHGPATLARIRSAIERRYRLLPYLYTVFEEASRTGLPVLRPLWLEYPSDAASQRNAESFLLGADLLVAPKLVEGNVGYAVRLPARGWYDTVTEALLPSGGPVQIPASADSVRLFVRAGAIIPEQPVVQFADQPASGPLTLDTWPGAPCSGALYLDDGQTFAFQSGALRRITYECKADAGSITVSSRSSGSFPIWWQETSLIVHAVARAPRTVTSAAGGALDFIYDGARHTVTVRVPGASAEWSARIAY